MSRAFMLKDTPFSVDYDLPKEISVARKALWSELKALKTNNPRVKCQIIYPAKLVVDGKVVRDEFPDWYTVMKGSRLSDFSYIDQTLSFDRARRTNKLKPPELQKIFDSSDVVLLTETWTNDFSDVAVKNFESYILNRNENKTKTKRNSGGIIVYLRNEFSSKDTLIFKSKDDFLWIKIYKPVLHLQHDLYICLCYVVPDESSRQSMIENNTFDRLLDSMAFLENNTQNSCHLLVCGDFNSRTSTQPDFVVNDDPVHMSVLPDDYTPDMQLPRFSEDKGHVNNNGLLLLDMCKQTGLRIMNGRVGGDTGIGRYTFVGSRGSSVVDYVIASQELFKFVKYFEVQEPNILSDHYSFNFMKNMC